jgi:hypothetical protein
MNHGRSSPLLLTEAYNPAMSLGQPELARDRHPAARAGRSLLVHQTVGNHTKDRRRRAWGVQYCRGEHRNEVTGEFCDNRAWVVRDGEIVDEPWSERRFDLVREHA